MVVSGLRPETRGGTVTGTRRKVDPLTRLVTSITLLFTNNAKGKDNDMVSINQEVLDDINQVITVSLDEATALHDEAGERISNIQDAQSQLSDIQNSLEDSQSALENVTNAIVEIQEVKDELDMLVVTV